MGPDAYLHRHKGRIKMNRTDKSLMAAAKRPVKIWWVMDEHDKCLDFSDHGEYLSYVGRKLSNYRSRGFDVNVDEGNGTALFTLSKDGDVRTLRMTEVRD